MKKLYAIVVALTLGTYVGITKPMFAGLTKRVTGLYERFFVATPRTPQSYVFYAPRESYSYFSPHFNMYNYVGIDYSGNKTTAKLTADLNAGVRGFIMPVAIHNKFLSIANTGTSLNNAFAQIAGFSGLNNEIVIVHLKNTKAHEKRIEALLKNKTIESLIFKPGDRLKDIEKNAAWARINTLGDDADVWVWPRLKWNYANNKLVMITWDSDQKSDYCWNYDKYFTNNPTSADKLVTQTAVSIQSVQPAVTTQRSTIFYSDVLRAELTAGLGITTALAMLMIYNYFNTCITQMAAPPVIPSGSNIQQPLPSDLNEQRDVLYEHYYKEEYNRLHKQAVTQKTDEYVNKFVEQRYGAELNVLQQRVETLGEELDRPRNTYFDRLLTMVNMARSQEENMNLALQWKHAQNDYLNKKSELSNAVRPEAREMAIKDISLSLAQQWADQAAAIAVQKIAPMAERFIKMAAQRVQNNLSAAYYSQLVGYGAMSLTALAALGIYTAGTTKNLFTVVKKEDVPAYPFGIFLTKSLTQADIDTVNSSNNTIFHTVSERNRNNFTVINKFQRSFLMTIADRARRVASSARK